MHSSDTHQPTTKPGAWRRWWADERGVSALEYALIGTLVAVVALVGISAFSVSLGEFYDTWVQKVIEAL